MNTFGNILRLTTFGESHGPAIGGILDGFPPNLTIDTTFIQKELDRRKPGQSTLTSPRREKDTLEILSGIFEGKSTGTPIAFLVRNEDSKPEDYDALREIYRPSHADFTYQAKYGFRDYRGGGRASARETLSRVVAGAFAKMLLADSGIRVMAYTSAIGPFRTEKHYKDLDLSTVEQHPTRCPDPEIASRMMQYLEDLKAEGDSSGSVVNCIVTGCPAGLGEPVFDKLEADLAKAMLSINASMGFEFGSGFGAALRRGSENNDNYLPGAKINTSSNHSGGIQGGISNGNDIYFRVAFKPASSISKEQQAVNHQGEEVRLAIKGRHDPCLAPRAVPVVEAMAALVVADHLLRFRAYR